MSFQEISSDILVIHQNRIIFSSGKGHLTQHSKISATVTQVLTLFSQKIMKGERIHFIRFEKHRMIFLFPQDQKDDSLVAIVLIPFQRSARQVIPAMGIILRMIESFLHGEILDAQNKQLDCFYQILSNPEKSLIVVPRSPEGILSALVILTAFAHDMQYGIQQIIANIIFVDPKNPQVLSEIVQKSQNYRILSFIHLPEVEQNENIILFGLEAQLRQYFSALQDEQVYDVISRVFGEQSNAMRMRTFVANDEAREIAQSISLLPESEDEFIRKEILLNTVTHPGKDIIVTLSTPVMQKLRELSNSISPSENMAVEEVSELPEDLTELTLKIKEDRQEIEDTKELLTDTVVHPSIELIEDPDAIPTKQTEVVPPIRVKTPNFESISDN
ncbi:MAG: hypothetical protein ACW97X_09130, partial [Candidatus Hodarchaeales archaeon]